MTTELGIQRAKQGGQRLAPAFGGSVQVLKIFLESQVHILVAETGANQFGHAFHNGHVSAAVGVRFSQIGVKAPGHAGAGGGFAIHRQFGSHGHGGGQLVFTAVRHQHGGSADGGVKPLAQAFLAANVQVANQVFQLFGKGGTGPLGLPYRAGQNMNIGMALGTVGVQELAGKVHDGNAVPVLAHPLFLGNGSNHGGFQVFLIGKGNELFGILSGNGNSHALLAFADSQLGAVQALVLLGNFVQVNVQAVGQLADGNGNAACAKVVAALDHAAGVLAAEQALQLTLNGGVALLHLGTAGF